VGPALSMLIGGFMLTHYGWRALFICIGLGSLLWLVPIGLAFGYLRDKHNTLWYGMIGHFAYNFSITFFEFKGWF